MQEKKIESRLIYNGKVLDLKLDTVELPNGKEANREVVVHPGAVTIAALTQNNEILLIRQFRYPAGEILWELPAGKLERGEDPLACAKRELSEETGYAASEWMSLSTFFTTPGFSDEIMYLYLAKGLYNERLEADDDEFIELHQIPYNEAVNLINRGEIKDAKTIIGILLAGQKN